MFQVLFKLFFLILQSISFINCEIKENESKTLDVNIIPTDQLCLVCRLVIRHWRNKVFDSNITEEFRNEMLKTCSTLRKESEVEKCRNGITTERLQILQKNSIEHICRTESFCKDEFPIIVNETDELKHAEQVKNYSPIPEVEARKNNLKETKIDQVTTIKKHKNENVSLTNAEENFQNMY